jgi:peptide/nickel transport system ATP-binding protein/oligopeptide transport system ATP-binding protein
MIQDAVTTATATVPVLTVSGLRKEFRVHTGGTSKTLTAIDGLDLTIAPGETVALVGESGSGKSTVARCIARLIQPTNGDVTLNGISLPSLRWKELTKAYTDLQMVFQDPNSSLNPRMTVEVMLDEPLRLHTSLGRAERHRRVGELLESVGLERAHLKRYPNQLSGGQRQRVSIARAFAADPKVVLLDEPTSSLDVSVRGQVLELLRRLQEERAIGYLFISHDLQVVRRLAHRVVVMYLGAVVEQGPTEQVFSAPTHPYTKALLSAAPEAAYGRVKKRFMLRGEAPSPIDLPPGCRLAERCPLAQESCRAAVPPLMSVSAEHMAACPVVVSGAADGA